MIYTLGMLLSSKPKIAEIIIDLLGEGSINTLVLLERVRTKTPVTKQGFYRALRELIEEEVVTKNNQTVLLSPLWVNKVQGFVDKISDTSLRKESEPLLHLVEGDTMVFRFKSITDLYLLWIHYFQILSQKMEGSVVFFNSHNFWALARSDIENDFYQWIKDSKKETYCVIGYDTPLDKATSRYLQTDYGISIAFEEKPSVKETIYPTVFGDYIVSTILDATTVNAIDDLYKKYTKWEPSVQTELEEIISRMRRSKVVIERNKKKAEQLRKRLMKYFVFYKTD
jgi:hypothetical protein